MKACYRIEIEQEEDGRFLAEVADLPGVMAYGASADEALAHVQALALRVLADRLEHDDGPRGPVSVTFETSAAARVRRPGGRPGHRASSRRFSASGGP